MFKDQRHAKRIADQARSAFREAKANGDRQAQIKARAQYEVAEHWLRQNGW